MHDSVVLVGAPRVVGCPPDEGRIVVNVSEFQLWPVRDADLPGGKKRRKFLRFVRYLSGDEV
jgi:hypothetical protein